MGDRNVPSSSEDRTDGSSSSSDLERVNTNMTVALPQSGDRAEMSPNLSDRKNRLIARLARELRRAQAQPSIISIILTSSLPSQKYIFEAMRPHHLFLFHASSDENAARVESWKFNAVFSLDVGPDGAFVEVTSAMNKTSKFSIRCDWNRKRKFVCVNDSQIMEVKQPETWQTLFIRLLRIYSGPGLQIDTFKIEVTRKKCIKRVTRVVQAIQARIGNEIPCKKLLFDSSSRVTNKSQHCFNCFRSESVARIRISDGRFLNADNMFNARGHIVVYFSSFDDSGYNKLIKNWLESDITDQIFLVLMTEHYPMLNTLLDGILVRRVRSVQGKMDESYRVYRDDARRTEAGFMRCNGFLRFMCPPVDRHL